ncbi:tumor necrosis factor ligand superfamily member 10 [Ornithorhynchus anatinus]|uniref:Tumor necrosis factor ligand superfamily member n=1 Tax=Ornithorhynchus anatinus TaxID=9258 RepID=F7CZ84_ORNAN|nr:tumor necrosis factor ligand superfamily member 10 [Ornithorhynchus anatinus]
MSLQNMMSSGGPSSSQTCGLVLISTLLLQSVCVAVTYIYFTNELKQLRDTYAKSAIACLTNEDFGAFIWNWDPNDNEERNSSPCWQIKWQLLQLIRKEILRHFEDSSSRLEDQRQNILPPAKERGLNILQRIAAHVTGNYRKRNHLPRESSWLGGAVGQKINSWESAWKGHSFKQNVELRNGELIIPRSGFYYIYSQTYFRFLEPEENSESSLVNGRTKKSEQMVQYIYKITSYPEPILLLKSARTSCWSKNSKYGLHSIYQGGVFEFKQNDRIFVSVSNESMIDMDKEASFFGTFLIG